MKANSILEILNSRDERVKKHRELMDRYHLPIISYTLNLAGNIKKSPIFDIIFNQGLELIQSEIGDEVFKEIKRETTGNIAYYVVDCEIKTLKKKMVEIENREPSGRLYDIDVISQDLKPISRIDIGLVARSCIVCKRPYLECRKNKSHTIEEIIAITKKIAIEECATLFSHVASYSLVAELSTTPKPGLVDKSNNGSHSDMNYQLFIESIKTITPYLKKEFIASFNIEDKKDLFYEMKNIGMMAENDMLTATNNINTHKGAFFSLSTIGCGICHLLTNNEEPTVEKVRIFAKDFSIWAKKNNNLKNSNGYKVREFYCDFGIYDESINGYSSIFEGCNKYLNSFKREKYKEYISNFYKYKEFDYSVFQELIEEKSIRIFCTLLSYVRDSNIIHRGGFESLSNIHKSFKSIDDENLRINDLKLKLSKIDKTFIDDNLSPGGTADLLAITLFIMILKALNIII